ncbi:MAG: 4-(cytidine 5'-diphospho)-2-C-methyl-D-erythritol kinase [Bacteroides sp.]|nr:4-(cytidine 5'-diphospho)-2-C-methyl-D-erythritol kinase [Bacteroides sp.]
MVEFVNAKINIGLQIVKRREDGYHDLQTVFYPVGIYAGLPDNPESFCDILEVCNTDRSDVEFRFTGREVKCAEEDNLVCKAVRLFAEETGADTKGLRVTLEKHLPDGAGMGGGSADATFTLRLLNKQLAESERKSEEELAAMALKLGADCPFFVYNRPMYGEGVGELLTPINLDLSGLWLVVVKPDVYVSTREAFALITPKPGNVDLRTLNRENIREWQGVVKNDFEESIFPQHPELAEIKGLLLESGAIYASMSGSGSSIYGIFEKEAAARDAQLKFADNATIEASYLLKL